MRIPRLILFALLILLPACTSIRDISRIEPFSHSVGRPLVLKRDAVLCLTKVYNVWGFTHTEPVMFDEEWWCDPGDRRGMKNLPAGTALEVDKVLHIATLGGIRDTAFGKLHVPGEAPLEFRYSWYTVGDRPVPAPGGGLMIAEDPGADQ